MEIKRYGFGPPSAPSPLPSAWSSPHFITAAILGAVLPWVVTLCGMSEFAAWGAPIASGVVGFLFTWDDNRWAKGKAHAWIVGSAVPLAVYVGIWAIA